MCTRLGWSKIARRLESEDSKNTSGGSTEADGVAVSTAGEQRNTRGGAGGSARGSRGAAQGGGEVGGVGGRDDRDANTASAPGVRLSRRRDDRSAGGSGRSGSSGSGLSLGADSSGDLVSHVRGGGRRSTGVGSGRGGNLRSSRGGRRRRSAVRVGDTELGGVLVLASSLDDQEETVVGDIGLKAGAGSPFELAVVGDLLGNSLESLHVRALATEKDQRDGALGGRTPGDGVGLANGHGLVQTGSVDGVASRTLAVVRVGVGSSQSREGSESTEDGETHFCFLYFNWSDIDVKR